MLRVSHVRVSTLLPESDVTNVKQVIADIYNLVLAKSVIMIFPSN